MKHKLRITALVLILLAIVGFASLRLLSWYVVNHTDPIDVEPPCDYNSVMMSHSCSGDPTQFCDGSITMSKSVYCNESVKSPVLINARQYNQRIVLRNFRAIDCLTLSTIYIWT